MHAPPDGRGRRAGGTMILPYPEQSAAIRGKLEQGAALVACLCTTRCHKCADWWGSLQALAQEFPEACFVWLDVDENPDMVADIAGVDAFPFMLLRLTTGAVACVVPTLDSEGTEAFARDVRRALEGGGLGGMRAVAEPGLHGFLLE